jgi:energy-coupling factor transporter ATP-binding protein EcfA2
LRLGASREPAAAWGTVIGEATLDSLARAERWATAQLTRAAPRSPPTAGPAVYAADLCVGRPDARRLAEINLTLAPGEALIVAGVSGAGKSTLLHVLAGLMAHDGGALVRLGRAVPAGAGWTARLDGRVTLLSQQPAHHIIAATPRADIGWAEQVRGASPGTLAATVEVMAERLGIAHLLDRPIHTLSGGELRRVALAGALLPRPALLVLDEPTSGLDPLAAARICRIVADEARATGAAVVWATHDLHRLPPLPCQLLLLRDGRPCSCGPLAEGLHIERLVTAGLAEPPHLTGSPT